MIHDMHWSDDDNFMVSASSDSSVKLWNLTEKESDGITDKLKYNENDERFLQASLPHASYVYSAKIMPQSLLDE